MEHVIEVTDLRKTYGPGRVALAGVDLSVRRAEVFGLLGPNGAGKTTLVSILCTRRLADSGIARVEGYDVVDEPKAVRAMVGVAAQHVAFDRSLSVRENLVYHCRYHGFTRDEARAASDRAIDLLSLGSVADRNPGELSGGYGRRLVIARSLAHRPTVVFLDEPTLGLDQFARDDLWADIRRLSDDGVTVVLTTHYLSEAEQACDRVGILVDGKVAAVGTTDELQGNGRRQTMRVTCADHADGLRDALTRSAAFAVLDHGDTWLEIGCAEVGPALDEVVATATRAGVVITGIASRESDLESIFSSIVRHRAAEQPA